MPPGMRLSFHSAELSSGSQLYTSSLVVITIQITGILLWVFAGIEEVLISPFQPYVVGTLMGVLELFEFAKFFHLPSGYLAMFWEKSFDSDASSGAVCYPLPILFLEILSDLSRQQYSRCWWRCF
jgi:hypothetical protein